MNLFYDTKPFYPYICITSSNEKEIQELIQHLQKENISVTKFYEKPKYPASDGITYDYLLRISFKSSQSKEKPDKELIERIFKTFRSKNTKKETNISEEHEKLLESDRKHFKQVRRFLNSERKILELDKQFFKEQLESLNKITLNLKKENNRVLKFIETYNNKVSDEISSLINNNSFDNNELKILEEKLSEKDKTLKKKESLIKAKEKELEEIKKSNENYREELEKEYQSLIKGIRDISLGINASEEEDSIQDLRILIFGNCKLKFEEIFEIFNKTFFQTFGENLDKKCIEAKYLDYKSIKNSDINKKIKQDKYDYIIVGQHDHSTKGKNSNHSYTRFIKDNNLKAIVNEDYDNPINKEKLTELSINIVSDWESQFEEIE